MNIKPQETNFAFDLFEALPLSLQMTIKSDAANERIDQIAQKYSITGNDLFELPMIAGQYILGVIAPDELVPTLVEDLGIGINKANQIAEDLFINIFSEIGPDFEKAHGYPARPKLLMLAHQEDTPVRTPETSVVDGYKDAIKTPATFSEELAKEEAVEIKKGIEEKPKENPIIKEPQNAPEIPAEDWGRDEDQEEDIPVKGATVPKNEMSGSAGLIINGEEQEDSAKVPENEPSTEDFKEVKPDNAGIKLSAVSPGKKLELEDLPKIKIIRGKKVKKQKPMAVAEKPTPPPAPVITPEPSEEPIVSAPTVIPTKEQTHATIPEEKPPHDYNNGNDPYREAIE